MDFYIRVSVTEGGSIQNWLIKENRFQMKTLNANESIFEKRASVLLNSSSCSHF